MCMLSTEQIVNNLNLTGNFLEARVFNELEQHEHFIVTAEWPFSQPTFQGTADIVTLNHQVSWQNDNLVVFAIECKKAKPDQKVWTFDVSRSKRDVYHPFIQKTSTGGILYNNTTGYILPSLSIHSTQDSPIFNKGYELRESDGNLNRNDAERIYTGLLQANKALFGAVKSNQTQIFNVPPQTFEDRSILFIPVVVTNAALKVLTYDPLKIDPKTAELSDKKIKIEDRDWVLFDFPLPNDLQLMGELNKVSVQPIKRPTLIVKADNAISVMESFCSDSKY